MGNEADLIDKKSRNSTFLFDIGISAYKSYQKQRDISTYDMKAGISPIWIKEYDQNYLLAFFSSAAPMK